MVIETADVVIATIAFVLIFNWEEIKRAQKKNTKLERWQKFYRENGVDFVRYEEMRDELKRREVDPPTFNANVDPTETMAELQVLMEEVPYVHTSFLEPQPDFTTYSSKMEMWPRAREGDDAQE